MATAKDHAKEQLATAIAEAAKKRFKTESIELGDGLKVVVRELTKKDRLALIARLFITGPDGNPQVFDDKGQPTEADGWYKPKEGVVLVDEWLLATIQPPEIAADTIQALRGEDVADSVILDVYNAARRVNGMTVQEAAKN